MVFTTPGARNLAGYVVSGLAPDNAPLASVVRTNSDIYSLDVDLP